MSLKKLLLLLIPLLLAASGCGEKAGTTIPYNGQRFCSVVQGFNFLPSKQDPIGYITYLKIGNVECAADLEATDPMNPTSKIKVFGVVSWLTWRESPDEPVVFAAQVSGENQQKLAALGTTDLTDIDIKFSFTLYEYDIKARTYYQSLSSSGQVLKGNLYKQGEHFLFLMSTDTGIDVATPPNYNFQLGIKPAGIAQEIQIAGAAGKSEYKPWGGE